jgi:RNase P subunit RPR2
MGFWKEVFCQHCYHTDGLIMIDNGCKIRHREAYEAHKCCKCGKREQYGGSYP